MLQGLYGNRRTFLVFNLVSITLYFIVTIGCGYLQNLETFMWDGSVSYLSASKFMFGELKFIPHKSNEIRPFFYPLILGVIRSVTTNPYGIWLVLFIFRLISLNLIFFSVQTVTRSKMILLVPFIIFSTQISVMIQTLLILNPEITVIFLCSIWAFVFLKCDISRPKLKHLFILTLLLSLLAVTKPVFQIHLILFLFYACWKNYQKPKLLFVILIALLPIVIQISFMVKHHNVFGLSTIGDITMKRYLLAKIYAINEFGSVKNRFIEQARLKTERMSNREVFGYLWQHPSQTAIAIAQNVISENLLAPCLGAGKLIAATQKMNMLYYCFHFIFFPITIYGIAVSGNDLSVKLGGLYLFFLIIILTSGISFWQGDRLTVTSLPFWLIVYAVSLERLVAGKNEYPNAVLPHAVPRTRGIAVIGAGIAFLLCMFTLYMKSIPNLTSF